ncbi:homoserine dehydrogenase [Martiniozyma asiatica (nom. inval.)]|nr:homoserine dehydrogenase [Martiniozyma asiatica]
MSVNIAIVGAGLVGKAVLSQIQHLQKTAAIKYNVVYIATSRKAVFNEDVSALDISAALSKLADSSVAPLATGELIAFLKKSSTPAIMVDNTSNQDIAESYPAYVEAGISVATPNKKAFSSDYKLWKDIFVQGEGKGLVYHEASVGAGLPIITPLKEMIETGDEVLKIEGVLSGTLSYIFNQFSSSEPSNVKFSEVVKVAKELGYTEPDPRDDLNGMDVARKVTILARISGLQVESPSSFPIESLIPEPLQSVSSAQEYMDRLPEFDDEMEKLKESAAKEGKFLRYVGSVDMATGKASVGIVKVAPSHPLAGLQGSLNMVAITTKRYPDPAPLVIQGSGAGDAVTAMGVVGDIIKIAQRIAA